MTEIGRGSGRGNGTKKRCVLKFVLIAAAVLVLLFSVVSMVIVKSMYDDMFARYEKKEYSGYIRYSDVEGYDRSIVSFKSGVNSLAGYIYGEDNEKGLVVIAHGMGLGAEDYLAETMYFVDNGWRVFSYDCTGTHESQGNGTIGLAQSAIDLDAALAYIDRSDMMDGLPVMLYGHSWGGYAVAAVLKDHDDISAAVSLSGFNAPDGMLKEYSRSTFGWFSFAEYPFARMYQNLLFGDKASVTAVEGINSTDTPVMIIHGSEDETILYEGASIIACRNSITNPNVIYITCNDENQNGHGNLAQSEAAGQYIIEKNTEYQNLYDSYDGAIPDDVKDAYYDRIERSLTSDLDDVFMNDINSFFEKNLT